MIVSRKSKSLVVTVRARTVDVVVATESTEAVAASEVRVVVADVAATEVETLSVANVAPKKPKVLT
jgi:hypothetical protein